MYKTGFINKNKYLIINYKNTRRLILYCSGDLPIKIMKEYKKIATLNIC